MTNIRLGIDCRKDSYLEMGNPTTDAGDDDDDAAVVPAIF
jgi:hypothetical protein